MKSLDLVLFCLLIIANKAKVYEKCELYSILKRYGLDGYAGIALGHWICLVLYASEFDTEHYEFNQRYPSYGLFQLNGFIWCSNGRHFSENRCKTHCDMFLDDNITDDIACAKEVVKGEEDMMYWSRYREYCIHPMPEIVAWECVDPVK